MDSVTYGILGLAIAQAASTIAALVSGMNQRKAIRLEADNNKAALEAAAELADTRATRDRQWAIEDRILFAAELEVKMKASAADVAGTVRSTAAELAQKNGAGLAALTEIQRQHAADARIDHAEWRIKVDAAEATASKAADTITALVKENTALTVDATKHAQTAADVSKNVVDKISEYNKRLLACAPSLTMALARRRATDAPP